MGRGGRHYPEYLKHLSGEGDAEASEAMAETEAEGLSEGFTMGMDDE
jgi:hypothetical protein